MPHFSLYLKHNRALLLYMFKLKNSQFNTAETIVGYTQLNKVHTCSGAAYEFATGWRMTSELEQNIIAVRCAYDGTKLFGVFIITKYVLWYHGRFLH